MNSFARKVAVVLAIMAPLPALSMGCGGDKPADPKTAANAGSPASSAATPPKLPQQAPNSPTASAVRISDEIVKACGISAPDAYFAFDSADVKADNTRVLDQVATCFTTGALKGRGLRLVGHADPRGSNDYNMTLGQSRADAVAKYLVGKGMDKGKAESTTRGEMDATGSNEPSWAKDRRVDVVLGQ
jgi:peptidoglycan-associated lipoprotein